MLKQATIGVPTRELAWKQYCSLGFEEKFQNSHQRPSLWEEFDSPHSLGLDSFCRSKVNLIFFTMRAGKGEIGM